MGHGPFNQLKEFFFLVLPKSGRMFVCVDMCVYMYVISIVVTPVTYRFILLQTVVFRLFRVAHLALFN